MTEQVLVLHEDEASAVYFSILHVIKTRAWNLDDESEWSELVFLKTLQEKLRTYLDEGEGDDVRKV